MDDGSFALLQGVLSFNVIWCMSSHSGPIFQNAGGTGCSINLDPTAEVLSLNRGAMFEIMDNKGKTFRWLVSSGPKINSSLITARQILSDYGKLGGEHAFHVPTLRKALNETR